MRIGTRMKPRIRLQLIQLLAEHQDVFTRSHEDCSEGSIRRFGRKRSFSTEKYAIIVDEGD